ncbi:MAG: hypothetical protein ING19_17350 [Azospirillum sp.]|nr:hypothetical protein [Azospirillum sp.]
MTAAPDFADNSLSRGSGRFRILSAPELIVDVEASALEGGYPIEIAIADLAAGKVHAWLIRPHASWAWDAWSPESEKIHGLSKAEIDRGDDVTTVGQGIERVLAGRKLATDNGEYDGWWLARLFAAARMDSPIRLHPKRVDETCIAIAKHLGKPQSGLVDVLAMRAAHHDHSAAGDAAAWAGALELICGNAALVSGRMHEVFETWRGRAAAASPWRRTIFREKSKIPAPSSSPDTPGMTPPKTLPPR